MDPFKSNAAFGGCFWATPSSKPLKKILTARAPHPETCFWCACAQGDAPVFLSGFSLSRLKIISPNAALLLKGSI